MGHFACFLPLTSPLREKTEAQRGVAKPVNGQSWDGAKPGWSDSPRPPMARGTPPHARVLGPSRDGVRFSAEPVLLAARMWGKRKTSN